MTITKTRIIIGIGLIILIIIMGTMIILNKDKWFRQEINLTYPDGCKETYINGKLTTPECIEGRLMPKVEEGIIDIQYDTTIQ